MPLFFSILPDLMLVPDLSFVGPGRTNTGTIDKKYNIKIKIKTDTEGNAALG